MCGCGIWPVGRPAFAGTILAVVSSALLLTWPALGAGAGGGGSRAAMSFAWRIEGKATLVVGSGPRGTFRWPGESIVDRPHSYQREALQGPRL